jgi:hypothetical protein
MAVLEELVCGGRMFGEVYSSLPGITAQCGVEDGLKVSNFQSILDAAFFRELRKKPTVPVETHQIRSGADDSTSW